MAAAAVLDYYGYDGNAIDVRWQIGGEVFGRPINLRDLQEVVPPRQTHTRRGEIWYNFRDSRFTSQVVGGPLEFRSACQPAALLLCNLVKAVGGQIDVQSFGVADCQSYPVALGHETACQTDGLLNLARNAFLDLFPNVGNWIEFGCR